MTLKQQKDDSTGGTKYDPVDAFEQIQENLKKVIESKPVERTYENGYRNEVYYSEESDRLSYLRDYSKKYRKQPRILGMKKKDINNFFRKRQHACNEAKRGGDPLGLPPLSDLDELLSKESDLTIYDKVNEVNSDSEIDSSDDESNHENVE